MNTKNELSQQLGQYLLTHNGVMTSAESCTGGAVSAAITDIAGSSAWFDRAFITYSNEAKMEMLGVARDTLVVHGAVSEPIVAEMIRGALARSNATIGVAISGIAGPGGGTDEKPVGTVCFGFADKTGWQLIETLHFPGDREAVRQQATIHALRVLCDYLQPSSNF